MKKEENITARQLMSLVVMTQLGTEVLSLPHAEAGIAGHDTWLSVLLSGLAAQAGIMLIWWLGSRYSLRNFYAYLPLLAGRPAGASVILIYGCYYALSGLLLILLYTDILKRWIFVLTLTWVIILMLLIVCGYAATSTLKKLSYIAQSFMFFVYISFLLIIFSGIYGLDARNLLPILPNGWLPVMKGVFPAFSAYVGYDLLLYAYPFVKAQSKKKLLLAMTLANVFTILFYVAVCLICTMKFGLEQLKVIPEPIVFILKNYRVEILQSIDILFLIYYVCIVSTTIFVYFFLAAKAFLHLRNQGLGKQHVWVWAIVCVCFIGSFFLTKRNYILQFALLQDYTSIIMVVVLPAILLMISGIRGAVRSGT
ncbi:GerAB/ArcD/ProY family transporter [Paenibacillus sp. MMS18-CY102]|uniref:GerAB/ArcD/ProY family transporter n=1 Tax=Paenibacillus sp. MMS18-CY102 TaxID=2682849 RepID=UPI0013658883|nr:GerAB/ArcD/ProY family transporter [Paenibacillus sp. MMS18-CY102]MWC27946.1 GerAB/ArcD/ProY family transporter [Paenibacillus sp. MMS18-CY102]